MNRLMNHPKLSNIVKMLPRCRHCGNDGFVQKELRKTGVVLKGNQVCYFGADPTSDVGFICQKCGKLMPAIDAAKVAVSPGFRSIFKP